MATAQEMTSTLDKALVTAGADYRAAVVQLASRESTADVTSASEHADVDRIHYARTRVIALDVAREELSRMIAEGAPFAID